MRDYDELGMRQEWVPHLMYFHPRNVALKSVTTDEFGFRNTTGAKPSAPTALLVGGSSVFGIGATSDATTIPSLLNTATKYNWRNFGGRAFNSTQEAILVHLSNTKKIEGPIVVMSGVNNLTRSLMSGSFSKMFGAFFQQIQFSQRMATATLGNRDLAKQLFNGLRKKVGMGTDSSNASVQTTAAKSESYRAMLSVFERDCDYIQMLASHHSTSAVFMLQPFIPWMRKSLTSQESELFELLDQEAGDFSSILSELTEIKEKYKQDLKAICVSIGLEFIDLNEAPELQEPDWLFVDRAHFTDLGNSVVARSIVQYLKL